MCLPITNRNVRGGEEKRDWCVLSFEFLAGWYSMPCRSPCITQLTPGAPYITGPAAPGYTLQAHPSRPSPSSHRLICIQRHRRSFFIRRFMAALIQDEQLTEHSIRELRWRRWRRDYSFWRFLYNKFEISNDIFSQIRKVVIKQRYL